MPSEDSLAEPVTTSHFTGQRVKGQGWDLPLTCSLYSLPVTQQVPSPRGHWDYTVPGISPLSLRVPALSSSPRLRAMRPGQAGAQQEPGLEGCPRVEPGLGQEAREKGRGAEAPEPHILLPLPSLWLFDSNPGQWHWDLPTPDHGSSGTPSKESSEDQATTAGAPTWGAPSSAPPLTGSPRPCPTLEA